MCIMVLICGAHFNQHHLNKVGWLTPLFNWTQIYALCKYGYQVPAFGRFFFFLAPMVYISQNLPKWQELQNKRFY